MKYAIGFAAGVAVSIVWPIAWAKIQAVGRVVIAYARGKTGL